MNMRSAIMASCDVYFLAEMARRWYRPDPRWPIGLVSVLISTLNYPGRAGFGATRAWRKAQGKPWSIGDTIVHGIGQGFIADPLSLAVMTARLASGAPCSRI